MHRLLIAIRMLGDAAVRGSSHGEAVAVPPHLGSRCLDQAAAQVRPRSMQHSYSTLFTTRTPPRIDMLSVLSTPCVKPTDCHAATSAAVRCTTSPSSAAYLPSLPVPAQHAPCQQENVGNPNVQRQSLAARALRRAQAGPNHSLPQSHFMRRAARHPRARSEGQQGRPTWTRRRQPHPRGVHSGAE